MDRHVSPSRTHDMTPEEKVERLRQRSNQRRKSREEKKAQIDKGKQARAERMARIINARRSLPCINEGAVLEWCNTCQGEQKHVRECDIHDKCTRAYVSDKVKSCDKCDDYKADESELPMNRRTAHNTSMPPNSTPEREYSPSNGIRQFTANGKPKDGRVIWAYGVTTVPNRRDDLLLTTILSLRNAGFDYPRLFVDGDHDTESWRTEFGLEVTTRYPRVRTYGNWILSLAELYLRNPMADRYVIFQDDVIASKNLRKYLDTVDIPTKGYLNLITYPQNESLRDRHLGILKDGVGWYPSNQMGKGAQGLVFDRQGVFMLLTNHTMITRIMDVHRGWRNVDGAVCHVMKRAGYTEYVHSPSLIRHTGIDSEMGNKPQPIDLSFRGENWDALELVDQG